MEGKFYRFKTANHPHTNMAKAALNMMTKTCAPALAQEDRIFMTSVDTGWINDENPLERAAATAKASGFQTPIDEVDAAARILDPIFTGLEGHRSSGKDEEDVQDELQQQQQHKKKQKKVFVPPSGVFLKDYHETEW
jgi:NAD(P)-dependent dehydrogenase (short-subunit alcohol dehydrogenase family)